MIADAFTQSDYAINITDPQGLLIKVNRAYLDLYKIPDEALIECASAEGETVFRILLPAMRPTLPGTGMADPVSSTTSPMVIGDQKGGRP